MKVLDSVRFAARILACVPSEAAILETATVPAASPVAMVTEVAAPAGNPAETPALKDGYALLNSLLSLVRESRARKESDAGGREGDQGRVCPGRRAGFPSWAVDAKGALEASLIDKIFFYRYRRLLMHYKLIITPVVRGELLKELFERAFDDFTWNVTYEHWRWEDKDGIAKLAAATEEEFVQLMIYLDTRQKRDELKKKIGMRMLPPPPPPPGKKKAEAKITRITTEFIFLFNERKPARPRPRRVSLLSGSIGQE